ncbi:MAG: hypothetical protein JW801_05780 [Bacteroidales bacterium]|nr:hypothetical protein [Bacteroidales bacterium]
MTPSHNHKRKRYSILNQPVQTVADLQNLTPGEQFRVLEVRELTDSTYVLRFEKKSILFTAGQHITLGLPGDNQVREYSVYSPPGEDFLEVLIKEVDKGLVSKKLHRVKPGDLLRCEGPFGFFTLDEGKLKDQKYLFIATGTGIAPFHSIAGAYPGLDYNILHGVRYLNEAYERSAYPEDRYTLCTSKDDRGDFRGRVTDYLATHPTDSGTLVYLCGNCDMIYEAYDLLTKAGIPADQIKTEVYF